MSMYERDGAKKQCDGTYLGINHRYDVVVLEQGKGFNYKTDKFKETVDSG